MTFIYNLLPLWLWIILSLPFVIWIIHGCPRSAFDHGTVKATGWCTFWLLGYLLYKLNYGT